MLMHNCRFIDTASVFVEKTGKKTPKFDGYSQHGHLILLNGLVIAKYERNLMTKY